MYFSYVGKNAKRLQVRTSQTSLLKSKINKTKIIHSNLWRQQRSTTNTSPALYTQNLYWTKNAAFSYENKSKACVVFENYNWNIIMLNLIQSLTDHIKNKHSKTSNSLQKLMHKFKWLQSSTAPIVNIKKKKTEGKFFQSCVSKYSAVMS